MGRIVLVTTGGTIEKTFDERSGELANRRSIVHRMLSELRLEGVEVEVAELMSKDSLEMTDDDRAAIVAAVERAYAAPAAAEGGAEDGAAARPVAGVVVLLLTCIAALYHINPSYRVGQFFETTFDPSVLEMFACWQGGAELHVVPETKVMAPGGFIRQRAITVTHAVPSLVVMMHKFRQLAAGSMPSLRLSFFGGEGVPVASARLWQQAAPNCLITNQYGPTEAAVTCISRPFSEPPVETAGRGTIAIGTPFPGMEAAVVDESDPTRFLPPGEIGELALSGPQLAAGYLGDEEQTARRFPVLDHPELGRTRWYLTGDSAYCDAQGLFHCLGRIDNQVKVMGHRVELEEIEAHLRAVCQTDSVAAVAWPVVNGNPAGIVAFVSGAVVDPGLDVREAMKRRVPVYMVPSRVHAVDALPLSTNGKVDRKGLRTMLDEKVLT